MKTLLVFAFIQAIFYLSSGDWQHPHYSYRCLENKGAELFGVQPGGSIDVEGKKSVSECNSITQKDVIGSFIIKYTCMNDTKKGHNATIIIRDEVFYHTLSRRKRAQNPISPASLTNSDLTSVTSPSKSISISVASGNNSHSAKPTGAALTEPNYVGGQELHKVVITCLDIPIGGLNKTVAHVFQEKDYNKLPDNYKEVGAVEMRFKAVNDTASPDISSVYIGDEFYMFIKYMGEHKNYLVIPVECTAFGETWISKGREKSDNFVELWNIENYSSKNTQACAEHKELLEGFGRYNKTLIYAKMYGFRFAEKNYVTITCQVKIYNSISVGNKTNLCMNIPGNPVSGRRKRNIENVPFQTQALTKRLRVFDNKDVYLAENIGQRIKWETSLWMMIFATVTLHTWLADS